MSQLVFIHGPGAGACADAYTYQREHFPDSVAPTLPGHLEGKPCADVARYTEWVRGWLWAQGLHKDLVLVGYTLGAAIVRPAGTYELRLRALEDPKVYEEWLAFQRKAMHLVAPGLRERLLERHRQVGPLSQYHDLMAIDTFDVRNRIATLKPKLLLLRGLQDHGNPPEYEKEIHEAVPGSQYVKLSDAGHFPPTEIPEKFNALVEEFVAKLGD
jgi:pimeloyl-ACP methyl ester carboxylesterase